MIFICVSTQGAASLCPGLIAGCPYRAQPTGTHVPRASLRLPWADRRLPLQGAAYGLPYNPGCQIDGYRLEETGLIDGYRLAEMFFIDGYRLGETGFIDGYRLEETGFIDGYRLEETGVSAGYRLAETGCRPSMRSAQGKA